MSGCAGWFGVDGEAQYAWVDTPSAPATRTVVVLCPPLGLELIEAHRAFRVLGERLAAAGITSLRIDHVGTGESWSDPTAADAVPGWLDGVRRSVTLARESGAERVEVVGLRAGALLAGAAVGEGLRVDAFVAWDPYTSGRTMLRHERALLNVNLGGFEVLPIPAGAVEGAGLLFSPETVTSLQGVALDPRAVVEHSPVVDVLVRSDRPVPKELASAGDVSGVSVVEVDDMAVLLDVPVQQAHVPERTVDLVVARIAARAGARSSDPVEVALSATSRGRDRSGDRRLTERVVALGPRALASVVTEPADAEPIGTVVLTSASNVHRIGSARSWVELSRSLANAGLRAVRVDQYDVGDSPGATDGTGAVFYGGAVVSDVVDAVRALSSDPARDIAIAGLSAGAWSANLAARELAPRAAVLLNQWMWTTQVSPDGPGAPAPSGTKFNTRVAAHLQGTPRLLHAATRTNAVLRRLRPRAVSRWRAQRRRGDEHSDLLSPLLAQGTAVELVFSAKEAERFRRTHTVEEIDRVLAHPLVHEVEDVTWDHSLLTQATRDSVVAHVTRRLVALFADPAAPAVTAVTAVSPDPSVTRDP